MRRRTLWVALALLAWPGQADAIDVVARGEVVVRWHANPDTCATSGMCDRWGTLVWRPNPRGVQLDRRASFLDFFQGAIVARSYRATPSGTAACVDQPDGPYGVQTEQSGKGRFAVSLRGVEELSFGHCAGPLNADFAAAMPQSKPVSLAAARRHALIDLRGQSPFSTGAFVGEVSSTLMLRTRPERDTGSLSGGGSVPAGKGKLVAFGTLTGGYTITGFKGDAGFAFSGSDDAACTVFDTCGLSGELMLHPDLSGGKLYFDSTRRLRSGQRETQSSALAALRRGSTNVSGNGTPGNGDETRDDVGSPVPLTETATPADGARCSDTGQIPEALLDVFRATGGLSVRLTPSGNSAPDPLRTRCPGPASEEVGRLARAVIPFDALGDTTITVELRPDASFQAFGVRGSGQGAITLTLKRDYLRVQTALERVQHDGLGTL